MHKVIGFCYHRSRYTPRCFQIDFDEMDTAEEQPAAQNRMNPRTAKTMFVAGWALIASALLLAQAKGLDAGRARELIRRLGGGEMEKERVRIRSINPGVGGEDVIVEAQIETAFRFTREKGVWQVAEIRLGDRQWESIELLTEAVRREKTRRTTALMQKIAAGLEAYRRERGNYVVAEEVAVMVDHLAPRYLDPSVRFDLWGSPFSYHGTASSYRLTSSGPDQKAGTADDLVMENGALRARAE